jgi:hypothetical protein
VFNTTVAFLTRVTDDVRRQVTSFGEQHSVDTVIQHTIAHSWNHIGELRLTRSLLGFADPMTPPRDVDSSMALG